MSNGTYRNRGINDRACERLSLSWNILLELSDGNILQGTTVDVSPRGILMKIEELAMLMKIDELAMNSLRGMSGTLYMINNEGRFSTGYPCQVVRQSNEQVALEVEKSSAAAFGTYMTQELLKR